MKINISSTSTLFVFLFVFLIIGSATSKAQNFHIPENGLNTLYVSHKQELKILFIGSSTSKSQVHQPKIQLAFSPIKNLSTSIGYFKLKKEDITAIGPNGHEGNTFTANIGTYKRIGTHPTNKDKYLLLTFNLGLTTSSIKTYTRQYTSKFDTRRYYAQFSFGHHFKQWRWDLFFKYNRLDFLSGTIDLDVVQPEDTDAFRAIENEKYFNMMEYKGQLTYGKGFLQILMGFSFELPMHKTERFFFLDGGGFYFGATINLNKFATVVKVNQEKYIVD